jgi:hypothetical protein
VTSADVFAAVEIAEDADRNGACELYNIVQYLLSLFRFKAVVWQALSCNFSTGIAVNISIPNKILAFS